MQKKILKIFTKIKKMGIDDKSNYYSGPGSRDKYIVRHYLPTKW